jgi:hypothetical protein
MDQPTPYPELNTILRHLVGGVQDALADTFIGAYLQGSFAVGDFDEHSDVDFVVAVRDELSDAHVASLQSLHGRVYDLPSEWATHLEGSYFPVATLRGGRFRAHARIPGDLHPRELSIVSSSSYRARDTSATTRRAFS